MAIYKEVIEENYTIVGSPTITDDYVASDFSDSNYLISSAEFPSSFSSFDLITKTQVTSYTNHAVLFADTAEQRSYLIRSTTKAFSMYNGSSWINGVTAIPLNTWYWCRVIYDGSSWTGYVLEDQGYTLETLPSLDSWSLEWTSSSSWSQGVSFNIGTNTFYSGQYLRGYLDLANTKYVADETEWRAVQTILKDVSGSVKISKGYWSNGVYKIIMPTSTYSFDALTANQTLGGKNRLFAYTDSTDLTGALISSRIPTGSFKILKELLEQPVYLDPTKNYIAGGELIYPTVSFIGTDVSSTKALQYSEAQDTTYWIPSEATVSLDSVKALQSVGPANDLYLTTTAETPTASLSFSDDGDIAGAATKFPLKQKVYLNNETDTILGVQERPDEIAISTNVTENYTVTGSPTITDDYVASDFSNSNWIAPTLNIPQPTDTDVLEIFMRVTVPTSYSGNRAFFNRSDKDRGFYAQSSSKKFGFYDGSSHLSITATAGQTYWVGYTQDANKACAFAAMLDDGTYSSVDELPSLSDSAWGTPITWTSSEFTMVGDNVFSLGYNKTASTNWGDGKIYLQDTVVRVVSAEGTPTTLNWTPVDIQDGISASGWSHYGPTKALQFMSGVSFESVAVTPAESYSISELSPPTTSLLTYPLFYTIGGALTLNGSYQASSSWYTGYKVTFTDTAHTTIDSVEKTSTRCRLYCAKTGTDTSTYGQELTYYAVTIPQFETGLVSGVQIKKEAVINQDEGPIPLTFTGTVTVDTEVVYSSTEDTITEGSTTAIFVGEFIVEV